MKTQISRNSRNPDKRYSGVYQQQGRMLTDADWNELGDIIKERLDDALRDVIGSGSPRDRGVIRMAAGSGEVTLHWGHVYVDGVLAEVRPDSPGLAAFDYTRQADFPQPPPLPGTDHRLYLDVWERAVTSLEDGNLRDPGLHGADTCTRTQTMAQVKWCPAGVNPEDPAVNPQRGNAALTLVLRQGSTEPDPCDPCADEVALQERVGNYLFRVEVHDVEVDGDGKARKLVLKWSSDNGAEECEVGSEPPGFKTGRRVFEFFSGASKAYASEKHLGVHLAAGAWKPVRGALSTGYPDTPPAGYTQVRRWDGYCTLERNGDGTWSLAKSLGGAVLGSDRGVVLSTTSASDAPGHVALSASLEIQLDALVLTLELNDRVFVAGDTWYAVVREAVHRSGDTVLSASAPVGVIHHYMTLATISGGVITAHQGEQCQRSPFPSLTDLRAGDICYDNERCDMPEVDTVQDAIDHLCQERDLRHHNKHLHGWGIVCGLQVQCGPDTSPGELHELHEPGELIERREPGELHARDELRVLERDEERHAAREPARRQVTVRKGYALDCEGNDIVLEEPSHIDVVELIKKYDSSHDKPLLRDGKGTVCLTVATGKKGKPRFGVTAYQSDDNLRALLDGTIWDDFFTRCIKNLIDELRDEFIPDTSDHSLVSPAQKRLTTLMNLLVHLYSEDGQYVFLSRKEHDILEKLYVRLRDLLQSKTFCGMYAGDDFPAYPFPDTTLSTIFGKGFHSRMRLHPDGVHAYTCSGTDNKIHVYDLSKQEMVAVLEMPAGEGAEVEDIAFSPDGRRLYAVAVLRDMDTIFGVAEIAGGEHTWRRVTVLCDVKLVTLMTAPGQDELVYAIGVGAASGDLRAGLFFLIPDQLLDQDKPRIQPKFRFDATGQMTLDESTGWIYAAAISSKQGTASIYDSIVAMDARTPPQGDNHAPASTTMLNIGTMMASGNDDMVWVRAGGRGRVYIVAHSGKDKRILGYGVAGKEVVDAGIQIPVQDTMVRLAYHRGASKLLATVANGFRVQIIDIASNEITVFRHPAQILPISIATAARHTYVLNFASNTITVIPDKELGAADKKFLMTLRQYRYQVLALFLHLVGGLLQYLKDCFCDRLLVDCPSCDDDDTLYLACIELRDNKVYRICNFSKRKYVKSFPTVGYWMSLVPIMPLAKKAVEKFCCAILPNFFDRIADKYKPRESGIAGFASGMTQPGLRADTMVGAVKLARRADIRGEVRAQKKGLTVYRRLAADALVNRVRETSVARAGARKSLFVGSEVESARERLKERHIEVESVEAYDPDRSGAHLSEFRDTPLRVPPGTRVKLYERDGKVLFYAPVKEDRVVATGVSPEVEAEIAVLERRKAALRDLAEVNAELATLEARRAEATNLAEVSAVRTELDALEAELDTLRTERAREAERLSELDAQRRTMLAGVTSLRTSLDELGKLHKELAREVARTRPVRDVEGVSENVDVALRELGIRTVAELASVDVNRLTTGASMDRASAARLVASARKRLNLE